MTTPESRQSDTPIPLGPIEEDFKTLLKVHEETNALVEQLQRQRDELAAEATNQQSTIKTIARQLQVAGKRMIELKRECGELITKNQELAAENAALKERLKKYE